MMMSKLKDLILSNNNNKTVPVMRNFSLSCGSELSPNKIRTIDGAPGCFLGSVEKTLLPRTLYTPEAESNGNWQGNFLRTGTY